MDHIFSAVFNSRNYLNSFGNFKPFYSPTDESYALFLMESSARQTHDYLSQSVTSA